MMHSSDGTYESDFASHSHELDWNSIDLECDKQYLSDSSDSNDERGEKISQLSFSLGQLTIMSLMCCLISCCVYSTDFILSCL
jgi:hypothetical protein